MARSEDERSRLTGNRPVQLRFKIGAYSPATMPMARLARYLDNLATVLGEPSSVHLVSVEDGSTVPVVAVAREAYLFPDPGPGTDGANRTESRATRWRFSCRRSSSADPGDDHFLGCVRQVVQMRMLTSVMESGVSTSGT